MGVLVKMLPGLVTVAVIAVLMLTTSLGLFRAALIAVVSGLVVLSLGTYASRR